MSHIERMYNHFALYLIGLSKGDAQTVQQGLKGEVFAPQNGQFIAEVSGRWNGFRLRQRA